MFILMNKYLNKIIHFKFLTKPKLKMTFKLRFYNM
jgi:hypothetical protein